MSSPAPVVILAEDQRQARLVRAYLRSLHPKLHHKAIHDAPMANGRASGAQWVANHYESEVLAHLIRRAKLPDQSRSEKWLIVVIDADAGTVLDRLNDFRKRIAGSKDSRVRKCRVEASNIAHLIPKWSVETWILNLNGETIEEDTSYRAQRGAWDELIPKAALELHQWVRRGEALPQCFTPSLKEGIGELRRLTT